MTLKQSIAQSCIMRGTENKCKTPNHKDLSDCSVTALCFLEHLCLAPCSLNEMMAQQCNVCDKMSCQYLSPAAYPLYAARMD